MTGTQTLSLDALQRLCEGAASRAGANRRTAVAIASATVRAEAEGQPNVGLAHLLDYLAALKEGRLDGNALPRITRPALTMILSDAGGGAAHTGFDEIFDELVAAARLFGLGLFCQKNTYTSGALGYFAARLAEHGLVALAATSGPALMAGSGSRQSVFCTNPLAFAAPQANGPPLVIDQASSATAFVNIRHAAAEGRAIPQGWAIDVSGEPTTDPVAALAGALLPFGGSRGGNIALMVEVLAAGLTGANWALDAPSFTEGDQSPGAGLFVLAIEPRLIAPDFAQRMAAQMARLSADYSVHIPGLGKADHAARATGEGISVPQELIDRIANFG